jgi:general secretion pathway protein K
VPSARTSRAAAPDGRGFALIIVLWTLVLIALITASLVATGSVRLRVAGNLSDNAVTTAAAAGAVSRTIFQLLHADPKRRWRLDGAVHFFTIGDCRITVRVYDEAGRINPNLAAPALMSALLQVTGSNPATARQLANAIGEWAGVAGGAEMPDAMIAEYRQAGRDYGPPAQPFETLDELLGVLGMTPAIYAKIAPHLSLFAPAVPVSQEADPVVAAALAALSNNAAGQNDPAAANTGALTARIDVVAEGPDDARATATVISRILPGSTDYTILAWNHGREAQ